LKQLLDKLKKAQLFDIYLDGTTDNSEEVQLVVCCRFANQETETTVELCCLNVGVCSTAQAIFAKLKQFIEKNNFDWMKYKAVATKKQQTCNALLKELSEKSKTFPLTVFQPVFFGDFSVTDRCCFEMTKKAEVNLVIMPFSVIQKCPKNKKNVRKFLSYFLKMTEMSQRKQT